MTLREIAEAWKRDTRRSFLTVEWSDAIVTLLNTIVEERRKVLDLRHELKHSRKCLVDHYLKALHELNLEGMGLGKEG